MTQTYILGGYTQRTNPGIQEISFNPADTTFSPTSLISQVANPAFLCLNKAKTVLFSILQAEGAAGLVAFKKDSNSKWQEMDRSLATDIPACHLSYCEKSQTIYACNYHLGQIDVYHWDDSQLNHRQCIKHHGSSVHPNQKSPHVHYGGLNQEESFLFVCDLGTDKVLTYAVDDEGLLKLAAELILPAGTGPRHLVLNENRQRLYVNGELNNTTHVLDLAADGALKLLQTVTNLPDNFDGEATSAAIRLSRDQRFLYVSTRFYNVITVFEVSPLDGKLKQIQIIPSGGEIPRDFVLGPQDQHLLVAHQDSDYLTIFDRDEESGRLTYKGQGPYAPECVCLQEA